MAAEGQGANPAIIDNLDPEIKDILSAATLANKDDIVLALLDQSDESVKAARLLLFNVAIDCLDGVTDGENPANKIEELRPSDRRKMKRYCEDVYELFIFIEELTEVFPRDILHRTAKTAAILTPAVRRKKKDTADKRDDILEIEFPDPPDIASLARHLVTVVGRLNDANKRISDLQEKHNIEIEAVKRDYEGRFNTLQSLMPSGKEENTCSADKDGPCESDTSLPCDQRSPIPVSDSSTEENSQEEDTPTRPTYAQTAATEGPWLTQRKQTKNARRKTKNLEKARAKKQAEVEREANHPAPPTDGQQANAFVLKGVRRVKPAHLYLGNINVHHSAEDEDICKALIDHAADKGIRIMSCHVIRNRVVADTVGCKITVPVAHAEACLDEASWPSYMQCREWEIRQRRRHPYQNGQKWDPNRPLIVGLGGNNQRKVNFDEYEEEADEDWD